jgi:hypothetical protein
VIPLYGFLEGDALGLLVFAQETDSMAELAARLEQAASVRVRPGRSVQVEIAGTPVPDGRTVAAAGLGALDRFDVRVRR